MRLKHKQVFDRLRAKFHLKYYKGKGGIEPKNYTIFHDDNNIKRIVIENIPSSKYHFKAVYIMFIPYDDLTDDKVLDKYLKDCENIYNFIVNEYKEQTRGNGISIEISNNMEFTTYML